MAIRIGSTVINCADLDRMTRFWSAALGLEPTAGGVTGRFRLLRGDRVNLSLQRADTPVSARDQMHLDLYSDDVDDQVERLTGLGAAVVRSDRDAGGRYVVLTDPEGNAFCVCEKDPPL